jgi:hypothetical protein
MWSKRKNIKVFRMKNINQLFRGNTKLMDEPEVQELIDYCRELEGKVLERNIDDTYDKEQFYVQAFKDIYESIEQTLKDEEEAIRFKETQQVDFKECILNLKKYMLVINRLYGLEL